MQELTPEQEELLQALESGEYRQTENRLSFGEDNDIAYCCMGVMCALGLKAKVITEYSDIGSFPPGPICDYYRLRSTDTDFAYGRHEAKEKDEDDIKTIGSALLAVYNDVLQLDFKAIAVRIRANPTKFFYSEEEWKALQEQIKRHGENQDPKRP